MESEGRVGLGWVGYYRVRGVRGEWIRLGGILQGEGRMDLVLMGYYRVRGVRGEWVRLGGILQGKGSEGRMD